MSRLDSRLLRALDDWLFPERVACLCCDAALGGDDQSGLCPGCAQALSRLAGEIEALPPPAGIDEALAAFPYADQPRQLILMLKFNSVRAAACGRGASIRRSFWPSVSAKSGACPSFPRSPAGMSTRRRRS